MFILWLLKHFKNVSFDILVQSPVETALSVFDVSTVASNVL